MSLLCVRVKKAKLQGPPDKFNTYVTLKVQNVKSTTVAVRGAQPSWEQDFLFEISRLDLGLIVEVWNKGLIWDTLVGTAWIALESIRQSDEEGPGEWSTLEAEVLMNGQEVCGTKNPTPHRILLDTRFELPFDIPEDEAKYWTKKLKQMNSLEEEEEPSPTEEEQLMPPAASQCSSEGHESAVEDRDSDYRSETSTSLPPAYCTTSQPNASAHQFRGASRLQQQGVCMEPLRGYASDEQTGMSPASSSKFGSSGNISPGSSQLSEPEQPGSEQEEELPEAGSVALTLPDIQEPPRELAEPQEARQEGGEEEAEEGGRSQLPGEEEGTPKAAPEPPGSLLDENESLLFAPARARWIRAITKVRLQFQEGPNDGQPPESPWFKGGPAGGLYGIDSMPDLRQRKPLPLVSDLVRGTPR